MRGEGGSALTIYMREVGQVELLSPREEIQLAAKIKKGSAEAREQMIRANLRLVVKIAREYEGLGVPLLDLINEGNIGLMCAVERFDPAKGAKLSTYGSWWIKQSIRRAIANQAKTIRLPVHMVDKIYHMHRAGLKLQEVFGREPTDVELAGELNVSVRSIAAMRIAAIRPASLDAPFGPRRDGAAGGRGAGRTGGVALRTARGKNGASACWRKWWAVCIRARPRCCVSGSGWTAGRSGRWRKWARNSASRASASGSCRIWPCENCAA